MLSPRNLLLAVLLFSLFVALGNAVTWTSIDYPGARNTTAWGINSTGQIVGSYYNPGPDNSHCFLYVNGTMTSFDYPGASLSAALGINDSGQIVGYYYNANSVQQHGFFLMAQPTRLLTRRMRPYRI